jgi:hypothetical protein
MWIEKYIEVEVKLDDFETEDLYDELVSRLSTQEICDFRKRLYDDLIEDRNRIKALKDSIYAMDRDEFQELLTIMINDYKYLDGGY